MIARYQGLLYRRPDCRYGVILQSMNALSEIFFFFLIRFFDIKKLLYFCSPFNQEAT
jgi:hypothetical protein